MNFEQLDVSSSFNVLKADSKTGVNRHEMSIDIYWPCYSKSGTCKESQSWIHSGSHLGWIAAASSLGEDSVES